MNEKPFHLPVDFGEALVRLARVPKAAVGNKRHPTVEKSTTLGDTKPGALTTRRAAGKRKPAS
jgi:hypothetical protein